MTLGLYQLYWLWVSARSAERFEPGGHQPFRLARWAIPAQIAGVLGLLGILLVSGQADAVLSGGTLDPAELEMAGSVLALGGVALLLAVVGGVAILVAEWRLWRFTEQHERRLGVDDPIRPGLMLAIAIGAGIAAQLVPTVGVLLGPAAVAYVLYRTQKGLNRVWRGPPGTQAGATWSIDSSR